jgi:ABC-2 type transport system permease protein
MSSFVLPVYSLWLRDLRHFFRRRSRVAGAIGQPVVIWILLSAGFLHSIDSGVTGGVGYGAYLFPGVLLLITLFSAIFSTISVIEDKKTGFMQGVLVSPVSRSVIVWSKMLAGTTLSLVQALVFMLLLPFAGIHLGLGAVLFSIVTLTGAGLMLSCFGLLLSWNMSSTQGFHAVMNLLLLPMWVLSGAMFPVDGAAPWLAALMRLNPMYYLSTLFQSSFFHSADVVVPGSPAPWVALAVSTALACVLYFFTIRTVSR